MADFQTKLDALEDELLRVTGRVVVAGDFNARAIEWGMPQPDSRGRLILEMVSRLGLLVINTGSVTTFRRPGYTETIPDITFASEALAPYIQRWAVMEDYTGSDHQYITFEVIDERYRLTRDKPVRWNLKKMNIELFAEELARGVQRTTNTRNTNERLTTENLVAATMRLITSACEKSMPRKKPRHDKPTVYWWTTEIAELRKKCLMLRRKAQRAKSRPEVNVTSAEHKSARKDLRRAINRSKAYCWRRLVEDIDNDPWGLGYKIVMQKLGAQHPPATMDAVPMEKIIRGLFPSHPERPRTGCEREIDVPLFTEEELEKAVLAEKSRKAPGPDGIPSEVLKLVFRQEPRLLLEMYNSCLGAGVFSSCWKRARLVLISKGKGDPSLPASYRPLCMLDSAGKVLERLIRERLKAAIEAAGDLSPRQYGFRAGRSTIDAIQEVVMAVKRAENHNQFSKRVVLLVTLDVRNAFNSAAWKDLIFALEHTFQIPGYLLRMLNDYLRDRSITYETMEGPKKMAVTAGVAQGSVLGPDLWNAYYDSLLRAEMPEETNLIGYADDVAALIAARDSKQAQLKLNQVMRTVSSWMGERGLELALEKTEIVILTKRRTQTILPMWAGREVIQTKPTAKYLGITIDVKLNFFEQIRQSADKAAKGVTALSRLMANVGGPKAGKRRLLMSAVQSVLLYGAEVWAESLDKEMYRKRLTQVQRRSALRVASAYRTVSETAVLVIAGVIPIELLARERRAIYLRYPGTNRETARLQERARTMECWQVAWENDDKGRWTSRLIVSVSSWIERGHGEINYYLTQFLSGHGYFRTYLHKMGKVISAECLYCPGSMDDAEHTFFKCQNWVMERNVLVTEVGLWSVQSAVETMLRGMYEWERVAHFVEKVLRRKKDDLDSRS